MRGEPSAQRPSGLDRLLSILVFAGFGLAGGLGYYVGSQGWTPTLSPVAHATPIPFTEPAASIASASNNRIARLIDGQNEFRRELRLHEFASQLTAEDLPGALNEALALPLTDRNAALAALIGRWVEFDPAAAAKYAFLLPKSADAASLRHMALRTWAQKDFATALEWVRGLEKGEVRSSGFSSLAVGLAKTNPTGALQFVAENLSGIEERRACFAVFGNWARADFDGALAAARTSEPHLLRLALRAVLEARMESDPQWVIELVIASKVAELNWTIARTALEYWLERDLPSARDFVLTLPLGDLRDEQLREVAGAMAQRNPAEAVTWAQGLPDESEAEDTLQRTLSIWAETDPEAALAAARALPEGRFRVAALQQMAASLIRSDVTTALELMLDVPAGNQRAETMQMVGSTWARHDPHTAATWFFAYDAPDGQGALRESLYEWLRSDSDAALAWAEALPDKQRKGECIGLILADTSEHDFPGAAAKIEALSGEVQDEAVREFIMTWTEHDPVAAAAWAVHLQDEKSRASAAGGEASEWADQDPVATAKWIETLAAGEVRDSAVVSYSNVVSRTNPVSALTWATTISDNDARQQTVRGIVTTWAKRNADAAHGWVRQTDTVSDALKAELLRLTAQNRGG